MKGGLELLRVSAMYGNSVCQGYLAESNEERELFGESPTYPDGFLFIPDWQVMIDRMKAALLEGHPKMMRAGGEEVMHTGAGASSLGPECEECRS